MCSTSNTKGDLKMIWETEVDVRTATFLVAATLLLGIAMGYSAGKGAAKEPIALRPPCPACSARLMDRANADRVEVLEAQAEARRIGVH